jgi:GT2 family glycosyltransferase
LRESSRPGARVFGVLVTYRRPGVLAAMLGCLSAQELPFETLFVVDNGGLPGTSDLLRAHEAKRLNVCPILPGDNLGPAGGFALGMRRAAEVAGPDDWVLLLEDDNPPPAQPARFLADLAMFASRLADAYPDTGAVGTGGARFDRRRGRMTRVRDEELAPVVPVDYVTNCLFPLYRMTAVRKAGVQDGRLFFGFDELEYGLRLQAAGYRLYLASAFCRLRRASGPREDRQARLLAPWRQYYGVRNLVHVLRTSGHPLAAVRIALAHGLLRPLVRRSGGPRLATLRLTLRGACDGWRGRLGRVVEPVVADHPAAG